MTHANATVSANPMKKNFIDALPQTCYLSIIWAFTDVICVYELSATVYCQSKKL